MASSTRDAVVVGAGIFGATAALELQRRGWRVTLVDRGSLPHADASSTDISKMVRMDYGSDVFYHELAEASLDGWERWNLEWPRPLYHGDGFLVLSSGPMRPGGFEFESHRVLGERGYAPPRLDSAALARRFPAWSGDRYPDGYFSPRGGWAESGEVVTYLLELAHAAGVRLVSGHITALAETGSRVGGVLVSKFRTPRSVGDAPVGGDTEVLRADRVVVCAGAWTPHLLPWTRPLLSSVAQPILHFGVDDPDRFSGPSFPPFAADISGSGWYGFPALPDGRLKLGHHGPGRPVAPDARGEVDDAHVARARRFFAEAIPSLAEAPVVGRRVCMYCDSRDGDLLVAPDPEREGLVVAAGGSGHAFKFAPSMGSIIADAVDGETSRWLDRFKWRTVDETRTEEARLQSDPRTENPGLRRGARNEP